AQRMAHTLKGAGNVVGVPGIANLMHYTEDLLELAAKRPDALPDGFDELLENASDCLASMAEFLCHSGEAPDNAVDVLQQILDFDKLIRSGASNVSRANILAADTTCKTSCTEQAISVESIQIPNEEFDSSEEFDIELLQNEMDELQQQLD